MMTNQNTFVSYDVTGVSYLQDSLGQAGLMGQAGPVFTVGVVLLGEIGLQRSELLAAETRSDPLGAPVGPPPRRPVVQPWLRTADRLLPFTRNLVLSFFTNKHGVFGEVGRN